MGSPTASSQKRLRVVEHVTGGAQAAAEALCVSACGHAQRRRIGRAPDLDMRNDAVRSGCWWGDAFSPRRLPHGECGVQGRSPWVLLLARTPPARLIGRHSRSDRAQRGCPRRGSALSDFAGGQVSPPTMSRAGGFDFDEVQLCK